jgi:hypothetical protein
VLVNSIDDVFGSSSAEPGEGTSGEVLDENFAD